MDLERLTLALLAKRGASKTVCPSEVARDLASHRGRSAEWRTMMSEVHAMIDRMVHEGLVGLSWKGHPLETRDGPYRIHLGPKRSA